MPFNEFDDNLVDDGMRMTYLARRVSELPKIKKALETQDFKSLEIFGHKMKGTGSSFNFKEISDFGSELEIYAQKKDLKKCSDINEQFRTFIINYKFF